FVTDPPSLLGAYPFEYATTGWGHDIDTIFVQADLELVNDGTAGDSLGCFPLINGAAIAGKIAVLYRGSCQFGVKALNAQNAGALGVLIINNVPDAPISPGAGTDGAQVTIPVAMISQANGAIIRAGMNAGTVNAMLGSKIGVFADDVGLYRPNIVNAHSWAIPSPIAQDSSQFHVPVGALVINFGQNLQSNVTLTATISLGGNVIYNQTSAAVSISSTDSSFISLPEFKQPTYANGLYTLDYSVNIPNDDFPDDDNLVTHFWIQPDHYSKSRWDTTTLQPIRISHIRTGSTVDEFGWCLVLDHEDAGNLTAYGMSFSATAGATLGSIQGVTIQTELFEWNDVIVDTLFFNNLVELTSNEFYDYTDSTDAGKFVTWMFLNPIPLSNNKRYLACLRVFDADVFIGGDSGIEYDMTDVAYNPSTTQIDDLSFLFPVRNTTGGVDQWFSGFSSGIVPAIILHTSPQGLIIGVEENSVSSTIVPYPNPANDMIVIPLSDVYNGKVTVKVYDIAGRTVISEEVNMNNLNNFRFSTSNLTNGMYHFNLQFNNGSRASFPVVIAR
ncbi:MAG: PA domain-containing protein, partial [Bacteroidia bacterium]